MNGNHERTPLLPFGNSNPTLFSSFKAALLSTYANILLLFVPLGIIAGVLEWSDTAVFTLNFFAIIPLAKMLGFATEEVGLRTNGTIAGLLNATFGNLVELMVSIIALKSGLIRVVQASLLGSILSNLLLVMGLCLFCGGIKFHVQEFNVTAAQVSNSMMSISVCSIMIPAAFYYMSRSDEAMLGLSRGTAVILLLIYILYIFFQLKTHADLFADQGEEHEEPQMTFHGAVLLLLIDTIILAFSADYLVASIEGLSENLNLSQTFVGLILLPIVGNAAEHISAVTSAMKDKMGLALGIAMGSSLQIALLVVPVAVISGWMMDIPMTLHFSVFETVCLFLSVFVANSIIGDGESTWLEGFMLLSVYAIVALGFYVLPE